LRIHVTFLFLLAFILLVEANRGGPKVIVRGCILAVMVLASALLHELGHVFASTRQGFPIKGVVLLPIGGIAVGDPNAPVDSARSLRREIIISLAGPLVNAILAGATAVVLFSLGPAPGLWLPPLVTVANLGVSFFWINLCLFAFNLLPAFPLDGWRREWTTARPRGAP